MNTFLYKSIIKIPFLDYEILKKDKEIAKKIEYKKKIYEFYKKINA